jgi:O-antigen/teichoic acid export membrane protein
MDKIKAFLFTNTNTKQTIIKNTFWLGFGEITSRLLKVAIIFYAIKILGSEQWGAFSYAISLGALFMIFSDVGISSLLTREISKQKEDQDKYIATSTIIKITISILSFLLMIFIAPLFATENLSREIIFLVATILVFDGFREYLFALNRGKEKMENEVSIKIITSLLLIFFTYFFLLQKSDVRSLALGYAIGSFLGFAYAFILFRKYFKNIWQNFSSKIVRPILADAWPFAFFAILGAIMMNTDSVMIGLIKNESEVGFYATSQRIVFFLYILPNLISISLLPSLSKKLEEQEELKNIVSSSIKFINMLLIPAILIVFLSGTQIVEFLFGSEYAPTGSILKISTFSLIFIFPAMIMNSVIFMFNKHKHIIRITIIGAILNILINLLLIPKYGGIGASLATLFSQGIIFFLMKNELNKIIEINLWSKMSKIILASIFAFFVLLTFKLLNINIILSIILSSISYFVLLLILKEDIFYKFKRNII